MKIIFSYELTSGSIPVFKPFMKCIKLYNLLIMVSFNTVLIRVSICIHKNSVEKKVRICGNAEKL